MYRGLAILRLYATLILFVFTLQYIIVELARVDYQLLPGTLRVTAELAPVDYSCYLALRVLCLN